MARQRRSRQDRGPSGLRALLFDAGNTLIYMPRNAAEVLQELCGPLGVSLSIEEAWGACIAAERYYTDHYLGYTGDQGEFWLRYYGEALRHLGIKDPDGEKAVHLSRGFGAAHVWQPYPEAAEMCALFRSMGFKLGVVSNGPIDVPDMLAQAGLSPHFDVIVTSQAAAVEKPDPRIFMMALEPLGVSPHEALFVGDIYEVDVVGARAAGLLGILIDRDGVSQGRDCDVIRTLHDLVPLVSPMSGTTGGAKRRLPKAGGHGR